MANEQHIQNPVLRSLNREIKRRIDTNKTVLRIKVFMFADKLLMSAKNTRTKQMVKFTLQGTREVTHNVIANLLNRNVNTSDNILTPYSDKGSLNYDPAKDNINGFMDQVVFFLCQDSEFVKVPFSLIEADRMPAKPIDNKVSIGTIKKVTQIFGPQVEGLIKLELEETDDIIMLPTDVIRKPNSGDLLVTNSKGEAQTFTPAKARYHFNFCEQFEEEMSA